MKARNRLILMVFVAFLRPVDRVDRRDGPRRRCHVWLGTFLAVLLLGTLKNGLVLLDINSNWQVAVTGLIIIIAVLLDARRRRRLGQD